jgi:hypothetical protein
MPWVKRKKNLLLGFKYQHIIGFYQGWQEGFLSLRQQENDK